MHFCKYKTFCTLLFVWLIKHIAFQLKNIDNMFPFFATEVYLFLSLVIHPRCRNKAVTCSYLSFIPRATVVLCRSSSLNIDSHLCSVILGKQPARIILIVLVRGTDYESLTMGVRVRSYDQPFCLDPMFLNHEWIESIFFYSWWTLKMKSKLDRRIKY